MLVAAVTLALPLALDPSSDVAFAMPKAEVLGVLAYAIAAALILVVVTEGPTAIPRSPIHIAVVAYLVVLCLASVFAVDHEMAVWGAYDRRLGLVSMVQLAVVYLGAATFVRSRADALVVLATASVAGAIVVAYGILEATGHDPIHWSSRAYASSSLGNSNPFGLYMATLAAGSLAALVALFPWRARRPVVAALMATTAMLLGGTILSSARAPLLGLGAAAVLSVGIAAATRWRGSGRRSVVALAGGTAVVAIIVVAFTSAGTRLGSLLSGSDASVRERSVIYRTIAEIVRDHPLLGVGPDNFAAVVNAYRPLEQLQFGAVATVSSEHGWPWRVALDTGVIGALVFLGLLASVGAIMLRRVRDGDWRAMTVVAALAAWFAAGVFTVDHVGTEWMPWLGFGLLVGMGTTNDLSPAHRYVRNLPVLAGALALGVLWPAAALVNDVSASRALVASRTAPVRGGAALALAQSAVDADDRWAAHWNNLGVRAIDAGDRTKALAAFERAAAIAPYDPLIWKNLGTLQAQLAATRPEMSATARESARRASAADPNNPEAHAGAIQIYLLLGDEESATAEADLITAEGTTDPVVLDLAAHAYLQAKRYEEARAQVERALQYGETVERRLLLGRVFIGEGNYAEARAQLQRVLVLDPKDQTAPALLAQIAGR